MAAAGWWGWGASTGTMPKRLRALYQEHQSHVLLVYLLALATNCRYLASGQAHPEVAAPALALQLLGAGLYAAAPRPRVRELSLAVGAGGGTLCAALALAHVHRLLACTVAALHAHALATLNAEIWLACRHAEEAAAVAGAHTPESDSI